MTEFPHLFTPIKIRNTTVRNRLMYTAHLTNYGVDGKASQRFIDYHVERAKGGIGLIVTESFPIHPTTQQSGASILLYNEDVEPGLIELTRRVHEAGAVIFCQLYHGGRAGGGNATRRAIVAPSPIQDMRSREIPHELLRSEIREIQDAFVECGVRAARCGYDGLEVHCAHSYLLGEFLSPFANKRTDEYGGSLENRTRIVREIIQRLRERVGDTIIGIRIIGDERVEDGLSNPEVVEICQVLEREGIDYVGMSMGHGPNAEMIFPPMAFERGPFVDVAAALKKAVNVPFYATHRIRDVTLAEEMVAKGQADIVSLTRPSLADPEIANKAREGRADDIRPCIACLEGCYARVRLGLPITCLANPAAGREAEFRITTADIGRKVAVVGGGPAGLEAARVLASRGHRVDLYERTGELGGQMRWAAALPVRGEMFDVVRWQIGQVKKLGVQILLNTEATIATLKAGGYEAVVVATGGAYVREAPAWAAGVPTITVPEAFDLTLPAGATVVVLDRDGHSKPMGFAERFADAGHQTVLMTEAADFGVDWDDLNVKLTMQRLRDKGVRFVSKMQDPRFDGSTLHVRHEGWPVQIADVATIVLADRPVAHDGLARQIDDEWPEIELHVAGDGVAPRRATDAIFDGYRVALAVGTPRASAAARR